MEEENAVPMPCSGLARPVFNCSNITLMSPPPTLMPPITSAMEDTVSSRPQNVPSRPRKISSPVM